MADTVYEYTDAQGGVHRVDSISQVPKDRLRHMLAIGGTEPAAGETSVAAPVSASTQKQMPPETYAVSAALFLYAVFSKKFLLRLFCALTAVIYLLYSGWDGFISSDLVKTAERKPKPKPPIVVDVE